VIATLEDPPLLALEWIDERAAAPGSDERFGRALARLHRAGAASFGLARDNVIGKLPQDNAACDDWPTFWATRRIEPQVRMAFDAGMVDRALAARFARLALRMPALCGPAEPPARLHGDLWSGNVMHDERGEPVLVDPAAYGGHREVDLAMMRLFGGFSARTFAAYDEAWPLAPGHADRVPLWQLYYLLVHVNMFGNSWLAGAVRALDRLE
jgi:fructosamine-3-kinase